MNKDLKELRLQREREDENKLLDAIHKQARDGYYFEKGKNYLKKKRTQKKEQLKYFGMKVALGIEVIAYTGLMYFIMCIK